MENLNKEHKIKTAAVICEFNPFHNGHKYCIESLRKKGATHIVCIMSGCFVQRGEPAAADPFIRAEAAVSDGADLVIELPVCFALSSAERFSDGAVRLINDLKCVDMIGFGAEYESEEKFENVISEIALTSENNYDIIKDKMKAGMSYPKAMAETVRQICGDNEAEFFDSGNNILALEYIMSLKKNRSSVKPVFIMRRGERHDSCNKSCSDFLSASLIRKLLSEGRYEEAFESMPEKMADLIKKSAENGCICRMDALERVLLYKIRMSSLQDFENIPDIGRQGLAQRFYSAADSASLDEFLFRVKTKRYPMARIKRHILNLAIGISPYDTTCCAPFGRILSFNKKGTEILKLSAENGGIPLSASMARLRSENAAAKRFAELEANAYKLYTLGYENISDGNIIYTKKISIMKNQKENNHDIS